MWEREPKRFTCDRETRFKRVGLGSVYFSAKIIPGLFAMRPLALIRAANPLRDDL
jgi:hypothetical protein